MQSNGFENLKNTYVTQSYKIHGQEKINFYKELIKEAEKYNLKQFSDFIKGILAAIDENYDLAKELYLSSISNGENFAYPWYGLGTVHYHLGSLSEGIRCYNKAIDLDKNFAFPWNGLGCIYFLTEQYERSQKCYEKALEIDSNYTNPLNGLGSLFNKLKKYDTAAGYYNKSLILDKNDIDTWVGLGNSYFYQKKYEESGKCFSSVLELDSKNKYSMNALGNVYYQLKAYEEAINCYNKTIEIDKTCPHPYRNLALIYSAQMDHKKALELSLEALTLYKATNDNYWISLVNKQIEDLENRINSEEKLNEEVKKNSKNHLIKVLEATKEIEEKVKSNKVVLSNFIEERKFDKTSQGIHFEVLRRWNSYTPIIADDYNISKGGGYFLKLDDCGIAIDPGFNFIDNFKHRGHLFNEIDIVLISHAHNDHTADLESILTLLYKYNQEIKDSDDITKEDTIRKEIAHRKGESVNQVTTEEIEQIFSNSERRKIINFYITSSVFKKYSGLFSLFSSTDYTIHVVEKGNTIDLCNGLRVEVIDAKHHDIISDRDSVGFVFNFGDSILIYTGDTGWNDKIEKEYKRIFHKYKSKYKLLVAHLGGFKEHENNYVLDQSINNSKAFYKHHLGRLGVARLCDVLKPNVCFISEFGEELKGNRVNLANIFQEAFDDEIKFLPADIGLYFNFVNKSIRAINEVSIDLKTVNYSDIDPIKVKASKIRRDFSLFYYNMNLERVEIVEALYNKFRTDE